VTNAFHNFRESNLFVVITTIFPVAAVVATVLLYLNADALRDQAAQHRIESSNLESRIDEKNAQIVLLNEQIKQKSTQVEILKSQVELLQKVNTHHTTLEAIKLQESDKKLADALAKVSGLEGKLAAFKDLKSQFGQAGEIASTISSLRANVEELEKESQSLLDRVAVYEPKHPVLTSAEIFEGKSKTLLNGKLTIGLIDAYGTFGFIVASNLGNVLMNRREISAGKNISIRINNSLYTLVIDSITEESIGITLLAGGR